MSGPTYRQKVALNDSQGTVKDYFIIVKEPGRAQETKRPPEPTSRGAERMMLELLRYRPTATLTLIRLTWNDELWVEDGEADLCETAILSGIDLPDGRVAKIRLKDRAAEVWVTAPGQRPRKSSGQHAGSVEALDAIVALFGASDPQALASGAEQVAPVNASQVPGMQQENDVSNPTAEG